MRSFLLVQVQSDGPERIIGIIDAENENDAASVIKENIIEERIPLLWGIKEYIFNDISPVRRAWGFHFVLRETEKITSHNQISHFR